MLEVKLNIDRGTFNVVILMDGKIKVSCSFRDYKKANRFIKRKTGKLIDQNKINPEEKDINLFCKCKEQFKTFKDGKVYYVNELSLPLHTINAVYDEDLNIVNLSNKLFNQKFEQ